MRRRQKYALANQAAREAAFSSAPDVVKFYEPTITPVKYTGPLVILDPHACTKCGRTVGRGRAMHEKHCKGAA